MTPEEFANAHPEEPEGEELTSGPAPEYGRTCRLSPKDPITGTRRAWFLYRRISGDLAAQKRYESMRSSGQSHSIAEMLATRSFPGIHGSDSIFMKGTHAQDGMLEQMRYAEAARQGVDTNGRRYIAGLARFPNDPEAWVSDRDDVLRLCRDRGWNSHGLVEYEAPPPEAPPTEVAIAPEIVDQHVAACLRAFPEGDHTPQLKADIRERVTQELTGEIELDTAPHVSDYEYADAIAISES